MYKRFKNVTQLSVRWCVGRSTDSFFLSSSSSFRALTSLRSLHADKQEEEEETSERTNERLNERRSPAPNTVALSLSRSLARTRRHKDRSRWTRLATRTRAERSFLPAEAARPPASCKQSERGQHSLTPH